MVTRRAPFESNYSTRLDSYGVGLVSLDEYRSMTPIKTTVLMGPQFDFEFSTLGFDSVKFFR